MAYNLKKTKAQVVDPNLAVWLQTFLASMEQAETMPTTDAIAAFEEKARQTTMAQQYMQQLQEIISQKQEALENTESLQKQMPAPEMGMDDQAVLTVTDQDAGENKQMKTASRKPFNLKKAQRSLTTPWTQASPPVAPAQGISDTLRDEGELGQQQYEEEQALLQQPTEVPEALPIEETTSPSQKVMEWLNGTNMANALTQVTDAGVDDPNVDVCKDLIQDYYDALDDPLIEDREKERKAGEVYDTLPQQMKAQFGGEESAGIPAQWKEVSGATEDIKKLAESTQAASTPKKPFNLKKEAQHKTQENVIMWGPGETRKVDPFLRQPVSDWHIVERNKGFGLVVDDVWNIDWETLWRENIMDKYSRPYKDKDGNWVGGYIQKRFEVDKNIPEATNIQLKPGEKRRPVLPEYGNTEARLQAARAAGDIEGGPVVDRSKPFNWKEASKKKR